jgi:hypothetical protein
MHTSCAWPAASVVAFGGAAKARGIPVVDCRRQEKKHRLAEDYLATHTVSRGVFLILVARAVAPIWEVARSARGVIHHLTSFRWQYSVYQLEYSRNLLFQAGSQMEEVFQKLVDRTPSRLHVPELRTLFGRRARPRPTRKQPLPTVAVAVEITAYDRTLFKVQFGKPDMKADTKGNGSSASRRWHTTPTR